MSKYHEVVYGNYNKSRIESFNEKLINRLFFPNQKHRTLLEVGCGMGELQMVLRDRFDSYGVDAEIDLNKDKIPYKKDFFDVVFTKSTIEHIHNTDHMLAEIKRVLKPGGQILVLTPAWEYNYKDFYNDYTHVKPFHRKGLQDALYIAGFQGVKVKYFYYLPWLWDVAECKNKWYLIPIVWWLRMFSPWKWRNAEENIHRPNIRFAQEVQLLGIGTK